MAVRRTKDVERLTVELPTDLAKRVDDYRFENRVPTRVGAIRTLIEAGLGSLSRKASKKAAKDPSDE